MSVMAWLFGLGALAVAFPFLFHLIRRTPKGRTEFSSLMFLKPSPPSLTRRSRLENILLMLLRIAAIVLIASAFMRPFFRGAETLTDANVAHRRVAILVDTSASMRRSGLWNSAGEQVERVLKGLEPGDDVALLTFDDQVHSIVAFDSGADDLQSRMQIVRDAHNSLTPGWGRSDLGQALVSVAEQLDIWRDGQLADNRHLTSRLQIVVVSDMQQGSKLDSLQAYQWPAHVFVEFQTLTPLDYSNATVQLLDPVPAQEDPSLRIRVANSSDSKREQFSVAWVDDEGNQRSDPVPFHVPAGTSRVVGVSPDDAFARRNLVLSGDAEEFDNTFFVVPVEQQELHVAYLGDDAPDDPENLQFYLQRALLETPSRAIFVQPFANGQSDFLTGNAKPTLVVVGSPVNESQRREIDNYLNLGGTLLVVLTDPELIENTTDWTGAESSGEQQAGRRDEYRMFAEIDFSSPFFQPFANPRYNDFTKIRFWKHQPVVLPEFDGNVIARFDNDDPAIWQRTVGEGRVVCFASGWQPRQSQLAISTKFVPLMNGLLNVAADLPELNKSLRVGDAIEFPPGPEGSRRSILKPDGNREVVDLDQTRFDHADQPGIYRLITATRDRQESDPPDALESQIAFAVNVDRSESETTPIPTEQIEMFDVKVGEQKTASGELSQLRELRDQEIEGRQKFWKWLIVAAISLLIVETWLAGRTGVRSMANETNPSTPTSSELSGELT